MFDDTKDAVNRRRTYNAQQKKGQMDKQRSTKQCIEN
jgi:hypothetical protein